MQSSVMIATSRRLLVAVFAGLILVLPVRAFAEDDSYDHDHDLARELYERGEIHSLSEILSIVQARAPGQIIGVQLDRRGNGWVYRVQVVDDQGHRTIVDVDAGAAAVIDGGSVGGNGGHDGNSSQ
jgi:uncharacterized membrane protein YkoI